MDAVAESQDVINQREWDSPWNWSEYGFYSSKVDSRLWVPKRAGTGIGQAINLAHSGAKLFIAGVLIAPVTILAAIVFAAVYAN